MSKTLKCVDAQVQVVQTARICVVHLIRNALRFRPRELSDTTQAHYIPDLAV